MIAFSGLTEFYEARGGERSPESDYGFQNWDARIHVGCTGCITRPFHSCAMLRRLREIHVQLRVVHVQHTGDLYAVSADTLWLLDTVPDELPKPQVHSYFIDWAESPGPGRSISWFTARIAAVVLDRTAGSRTSVR